MPEQKASLCPARRGPTARSRHIVGLASAPFPGSRAKAPVTSSERRPVLLVLGHRTLTPLLPTPQCQRPTSREDLETKAQIHTHPIPHTPTRAHPHTLMPPPPHTPENLTCRARVESHTRGPAEGVHGSSQVLGRARPLGEEGAFFSIAQNPGPYSPGPGLPPTTELPPPPGLSGLWDLRTLRTPLAFSLEVPVPMWGTPNPSTALDLA